MMPLRSIEKPRPVSATVQVMPEVRETHRKRPRLISRSYASTGVPGGGLRRQRAPVQTAVWPSSPIRALCGRAELWQYATPLLSSQKRFAVGDRNATCLVYAQGVTVKRPPFQR